MIISHEHRFIFVKTRKTAGTSVEVLLSRLIEPDAIVTPIAPPVEGHQPRNYDRPFNPIPEMLQTRRFKRAMSDLKRHRTYFNHIDAERIRGRVGRRVWNSYYKFCFERDPWDKVVSWYYFVGKNLDPKPSFRDFVLTHDLPTDFDRYAIGGEVAMDFVGRFENLGADLATALAAVGLDASEGLTREKSGSRPAGATGEDLFTPELDAHVARVFAREIAYFGYEDRSRRAVSR